MPKLFNGVVKLTESQYASLKNNGSITVNGTTIDFDENTLYVTDYTIDDELDLNSENPVKNSVITKVLEEKTSNGVTLDTNQEISGNKNFIGEIKKNGKEIALREEIPTVSDSLDSTYKDNAMSVNQGIILNDKITTLIENVNGKVQSFSVEYLYNLGDFFGIDTSGDAKDEYIVSTNIITYKGKQYTLKTGDIFLIVDVKVPDYWFSLEDMKLFKMETSKVDLSNYVTNDKLENYFPLVGGKVVSGNLILDGSKASNNRATLKIQSGGNYPTDLYMGSGGQSQWSITARDSSLNYDLRLYNAISSKYAWSIHNTNNKMEFHERPNVNGEDLALLSEIPSFLTNYATKDYVNENGGKINKIFLNGEEQLITNDKSVYLEIQASSGGEPSITDYYKVKSKLTKISLNSVSVPGNYGIANDCTNMPVQENGTLFVGEYDNSSYVQQMFISESNIVYVRTSTSVDNSTWTEWQEMASKSSLNNYLLLDGSNTMTGPLNVSSGEKTGDDDKGIHFENGTYLGENTIGDLGINSKGTTYFKINSVSKLLISSGQFRPIDDKVMNLGSSSQKWLNIYGTVIYQDEKQVANKEDLDSYLKLNGGGGVYSDSLAPLIINRTGSPTFAAIGFQNSNGLLGYIGMTQQKDGGLWRLETDTTKQHLILDVSNYSNYALPLNGSKAMGGQLKAPYGIKTNYSESGAMNDLGIVFGDSGNKIGSSTNDIGLYSNGALYFRPAYDNGNNVSDGVIVNANELYPSTTNKMNLGLPTKSFKNIYANGKLELNIAPTDSQHSSILIKNGTSSTDTMIRLSRTDTGVTLALGVGGGGVNHGVYSDTLGKWMVYADTSKVYLNGNAETTSKLATPRYIDGTLFDGTKDITTRNGYVWSVGSDAANSGGWYKFAEQTMSGFGNTNLILTVNAGYTKGFAGILSIQVRSDSSNITMWKFGWLLTTGFSRNDICYKIDGMKWSAYVKNYSSRYGRIFFHTLSNGNINGDTGSGFTPVKSSAPEELPEGVVYADLTTIVGRALEADYSTKALKDNMGNEIYRTYTTLIPNGTDIPESADLNSLDYLKVGSYYCTTSSKAQTLINCPTGSAFMMTVYSPLNRSIDNEQYAWIYRTRKIMTLDGTEYTQLAYSDGTKTWIYGVWNKVTQKKDLDSYLPLTGKKIITGSITLADSVGIRSSDSKNLICCFTSDKVIYVGETDKTLYLQGANDRPTYLNSSGTGGKLALSNDLGTQCTFSLSGTVLTITPK